MPPRSKVEKIPIVTISNGQRRNADGAEWLGELFVTVLERIDGTVAIQFLFANRKDPVIEFDTKQDFARHRLRLQTEP